MKFIYAIFIDYSVVSHRDRSALSVFSISDQSLIFNSPQFLTAFFSVFQSCKAGGRGGVNSYYFEVLPNFSLRILYSSQLYRLSSRTISLLSNNFLFLEVLISHKPHAMSFS